MLPLLKPYHYTSAEWFAQEQARIFSRLWMLAAVQPMLAKHKDYRTLTLADKHIVLQNHQGKIRAFSNICRHRMAKIQKEEFGNRSLVCEYHHWCYGAEGELTHTHKDPKVFGFSPQETKDIRLEQYPVATVGKLIFINLHPNPLPLEQQFDAATLDLLERYTTDMDSSFIYTRYETNFNWKLGMENIKDALHPLCLHKSTFPEYFQVDAPVQNNVVGIYDHYSSVPRSLQEGTLKAAVPIVNPPPMDWKKQVHQLDCKGMYQVFHIFPNINLMIVDGSSFSLQIYNPLAPDRTEIQMMVALAKPVDSLDYKPVVLWEHLLSDIKVFQEDIDCLEPLQQSLHAAKNDFIHGAYETSILDFQAIYLSQMKIEEQ